MKIAALDHVVLRVEDPERMTRFYVDVLGCAVEKRNDAAKIVHLRAGDALIDLAWGAGPLPSGGSRNMEHLCLRLSDWNERAVRAHLAAHRITPSETKTNYGAQGHGPSVYLVDPEGNTVELKGPAA